MNVVYFVQSHRDPEQVYRLVRTLRQGSTSARIVVLHDSARCALDWSPLAALPRTYRLETTAKLIRSTFSCQVQPFLEVATWLEQEGFTYDWLVNLSAQDYPVRPIAEIEGELEASNVDAYIRYWDVFSPASPWSRRKARNRYWHRYRRLPDRAWPLLHAIRFVTKLLPVNFYLDCGPLVGVRVRTPFRDGFRCYGGWAWFHLRREAVLYFLDFLSNRPDVLRHYRGAVAPEESIVQTVLVNAGRFRLVNDDARYIDYSHAVHGSPRVLTVADLPLLAAGRLHFARKFDYGVDREVLDRIDRELLRI